MPWFVYVPGVAWIEHGHVYDEGCSFEFNLAPIDPKDGWLVYNVDYAAMRYLGTAVPDVDPHGIEEWSFWGYMRYTMGQGAAARSGGCGSRTAGSSWSLFYARAPASLVQAPRPPPPRAPRAARRRSPPQAASRSTPPRRSIASSRTPLTVSWRRLGRMLMLDRFGLGRSACSCAIVLLLIWLPLVWALLGAAAVIASAMLITRWLGQHLVTSQLPMRAVPQRLRKLVDAPVVVFGHTHDPRWQPLRGGGVYVNAGTWLPATRPGLRRSFTHVFIQPRPRAARRCRAPPVARGHEPAVRRRREHRRGRRDAPRHRVGRRRPPRWRGVSSGAPPADVGAS